MIINHNLGAINAQRNMGINSNAAAKNMEKLSSGLKINRAGDNAAGLSISEKMRAQIRGLDQASTNSEDGISMIQTAEGALNETHSILQRMRELAVQAGNDTNADTDRDAIQSEINQLTSEINRIGNTTEFNTQKLLNGDKANGVVTVTKGTSGLTNGLNLETLRTGAATNTVTTAGKAGVYKMTVNVSTAANGTVSISGGNLTIDSQTISVTASSSEELYTKIKDAFTANNTLNAKYTIELDSSDNSFKITQREHNYSATAVSVSAGGSSTVSTTGVAESSTTVSAVKSQYMISGDLTAGKVTIGGRSFTITGNTQQELYEHLNTAISNDSVLGDKYDTAALTNSGNAIVLTAKNGGTDVLTAGSKTAVAGVYNFQAGNNDVTIDGKTFEYENDFSNVEDLVNQINNDTDLKDKYTASVVSQDGIKYVQLKQNDGKESSTAPVITGTKDASVKLQIGANENQSMSIEIGDMRANALGLTSTTAKEGFTSNVSVTDGTNSTSVEYALNVSSYDTAKSAITTIESALEMVSNQRSALGAYQNRLEHTINNLNNSSENLTSAESRIRDTDMAKEMSDYSKNNILQQASQAMLAQAKSQPEQVLQLLR